MRRANPAVSSAQTSFHLSFSRDCFCVYGRQCKIKLKTELEYHTDQSQYKEIMLKLLKIFLIIHYEVKLLK